MSKSGLSKEAFKERQLKIAIERGLVPAPRGVDKAQVQHPMVDEAAIRAAATKPAREIYEVPEVPCPCKQAGLTEGRHKVNGGHCVDGTFWPTSAVTTLKYLKAFREGRSVDAEANAIGILNKELGLDLEQLQIIHNVRQH